MAADLSLLFRLRGDGTQLSSTLKSAATDSRAAANQLKQAFGPQLAQALNLTNETFSGLQDNLQNFVAQRVPLIGGAVVRISEGLRQVGGDSAKTDKALAGVARSIQSIATQSGKSVPQITAFLAKYSQLEGQSKKNEAAFKFFGGSVDLIGNKTAKFVPELDEASSALNAVSASSATAGARIAGMAGPIGIAVVAFIAFNAVGAIAIKQLIDLTKYTAEFQGKMHDLAQEVNLTVSSLSAFEVLAKRTGGELGTITQAVVLFQRKLDEAQNPLSKTAELFRKFNIETSDTETALRSAFDALARMPEGFAQTNAAAELFGARGGKQVLAILKEADGSLDEAIKKLEEMGILISGDMARSSDKLNDELAILELQWRALTALAVQDLIPILADIVRSFGQMITAIRPVVSILGTLTSVLARPVVSFFKGLSLVVQALTLDYVGLAKAIKEAREQQEIGPIKVQAQTPVPPPGPSTPEQSVSEAINRAEVVLANVKRAVAKREQVLNELFQKGKISRDQQAAETIANNKQVLDAEKDRIDKLLAQKEVEIRALDEAQQRRGEIVRRDTDDYRAITAEIVRLQQERIDKETDFEIRSREIRARVAKETADGKRAQIAADTDILVDGFDRQVKVIEAQAQRQEITEKQALAVIEVLERAKVDARITSLEKQREVGQLTVQNQIDLNNELNKLAQESARLLDEQLARRLQKLREAAETDRDIALGEVDALLQILQIRGQRIIDATTGLADRRVITEQQAAKKILQINLDLIDAEIDAFKARLTAASTIIDTNERLRAEAELNNQIKILIEQRKSIEADGERAIGEGLKRDIENRRRYADDLKDVSDQIRRVERAAAEEVIRLMRRRFASEREIIRERRRLDIDEEKEHHRDAINRLRRLRQENLESNKTDSEKLKFAREINRLREVELRRHNLAMRTIEEEAQEQLDRAGPGGGILEGLETGQLARLENGITSFSDVARVALSAVGVAFNQLAQAAGEAVRAFVLFGTAGGSFRKFAAEIIASIAQMAVVNAVWEVAQALAMLALTYFTGNPKYAQSAGAHFAAAAAYGLIGGVAALAGRGVAGGIFKPAGGDSRGGAGTSNREGAGQLNPLALERNSQQQVVRHEYVFRVESNDSHILNVFSKDYQSGGKTREIIVKDGEFAV